MGRGKGKHGNGTGVCCLGRNCIVPYLPSDMEPWESLALGACGLREHHEWNRFCEDYLPMYETGMYLWQLGAVLVILDPVRTLQDSTRSLQELNKNYLMIYPIRLC